jgi:hypothetical protein
MATDVVGYSKLMQSDEAAALGALAAIREATHNLIRAHRGRIANTAGDSVLAEFGSAVEAVSCAMALQEVLVNHAAVRGLQVRIGIHLGDVVEKTGDLFGTAVNIAARSGSNGVWQRGGCNTPRPQLRAQCGLPVHRHRGRGCSRVTTQASRPRWARCQYRPRQGRVSSPSSSPR